jgi:cation diffusion facilitator family transporter
MSTPEPATGPHAGPHDTSHIRTALLVNAGIAAMKGVGAFATGSGSMLAETLHSAADCINQALLLLGVRRAARPPDAAHPLGYGRALYFWSFLVALLLFSGGGVFSIYEGVHKIQHPEALENVGWAVGILAIGLVLEGASTWSNIRSLNARRGSVPFFRYLQRTKDSDLVVVFGENAAATLGLAVALAALGVATVTGDPRWDGAGSLGVGVVLVGVSIFLAIEVKALLLGEAAEPEVEAAVREVARTAPGVLGVLRVIALQQGPGEVLVAAKVRLTPELSVDGVYDTINAFERAVRARSPQIRWLFIEPDREA